LGRTRIRDRGFVEPGELELVVPEVPGVGLRKGASIPVSSVSLVSDGVGDCWA